ncbi:MAG: hypothetical protein NC541_10760 [bacterium]|nr:hypothetical protein [bacterium]
MKKILRDENLTALHGRKRLQYIWNYYKFPLAVLCIVLYIAGYAAYRSITHKDTVLYTALVNVVAGADLTERLGENFVDYLDLDSAKYELTLYTGLYLTDDELNEYHEYTYASRMKILASIEGEILDVVLMNREAFDAFSQNGYLCDLGDLLSRESPALYERLAADLVNGIEILEDNSSDLIFDESTPYQAVTAEYPMGLDLSRSALIREAGFEDTVYLGIIANSPRLDAALAYLEYLFMNR